MIYANGDVYNGEYKDDKSHGFGQYNHFYGGIYKGNWLENKKNGQGKETLPDNECYEG